MCGDRTYLSVPAERGRDAWAAGRLDAARLRVSELGEFMAAGALVGLQNKMLDLAHMDIKPENTFITICNRKVLPGATPGAPSGVLPGQTLFRTCDLGSLLRLNEVATATDSTLRTLAPETYLQHLRRPATAHHTTPAAAPPCTPGAPQQPSARAPRTLHVTDRNDVFSVSE